MLPTLQIVLRSGIVDLAWGHPSPDLLPVAALRQAVGEGLAKFKADALAYGADRGPAPLLHWVTRHISEREDCPVAAEEVLITGGNSQALMLLGSLVCVPGDVVLVESPTYHLAVRILRDLPLTLVPVPADDCGLNSEIVAAEVARLKREGQRVRMLYTVPTFHNPTGVSMGIERRRALVQLAENEGFVIIEDDVYRELSYDGPAPVSLWSLAPRGVVVRLGSFAKTLAPGLRLGWMTGGAELIDRIAGCGLLDSGGGVNHFTAMMVAVLCGAGKFEPHVAMLRAAYRERRDALLSVLHAELPAGCEVVHPAGGFFTWMRLPDSINTRALLPEAEKLGMSYLPGATFYLDHAPQNALRLAFSYYPPDQLQEAASRLADAVRAAVKR
jgi:DNA-binding transcriptional MocR family regulator